MKNPLIVTCALPYANSQLHLGYMLEAIQADIWVRVKRLLGHSCYFVCGDDAHGTPIMLKAEEQGITPEQLIANIYNSHLLDLEKFNISFDNYYTTHSSENEALASEIFLKLKANGDITSKEILQPFDTVKQMFLPDRFIKGICPKCKALEQYGDNCEACGATYAPLEMLEPKSILTNTTPEVKSSLHYFFNLSNYQQKLVTWLKEHVAEEVVNKLQEWFKEELHPWDISRDAPYFGFKIPGTDKYFYVWLDAPIGYLASLKNFCTKNKLDFEALIAEDSDSEIYHFIGKDIVYFHTVFWPAVLMGAKLKTPSRVFVHGFVTVNGQKMSKSRNTFILAENFHQHLDTDLLRYYFASKLNSKIEDLDFNIEEFVTKVNADLVGKIVNIASRNAGFLQKYFNNTLSLECHNQELINQLQQAQSEIIAFYEQQEYHRAIRLILELTDAVNRYIDAAKPWVLAKENNLPLLHKVASDGIRLFKLLASYLAPVLPNLAAKVSAWLNTNLDFSDLNNLLLGHNIGNFSPLINRLDTQEAIKIMSVEPTTINTAVTEDNANYISIEDFAKVDLRIAKIVHAEAVPEADKLLRLEVDLGEKETRQIFAGIKAHYTPESLIGKLTLVVANLAPRKMRFGISQGMLAVASGKEGIYLLEPQSGALPGMAVK